MSTVLDGILAAHRAAAAADERPLDDLLARAAAAPAPRPFRAALVESAGISLIAEVKRRSPSKGSLAPDLDPADLARRYQAGGATALSVLTDAEFFGGSADDLGRARDACRLPVLRKDFTVSDADVCDARLMGADAVLLIVAALDDGELARFAQLARQLGMAALFEVHTEAELDRALAAGADLVGVNRRDLRTFSVDLSLAERLAECVPADVAKVAESGVRDAVDVAHLAACGYDAVLVGETLVVDRDPELAVRRLRGAT
ncbi:MAG TPA: indole-3-glycerol phosphate synthase TrpC [Acidimicrobiales bacterium]|nr:indole-3-glycerol phosphate synthase TrpC [Acidimicrobiales bacterium]